MAKGMLIELSAQQDWQHAKFYFRSMEACNRFKYVFADHWCNVWWNEPKEVPESEVLSKSEYWREHIDDSPEKLADDNLKWGFNSVIPQQGNGLTESQTEFVNNFVNNIIA